jgi:hypothetical protein
MQNRYLSIAWSADGKGRTDTSLPQSHLSGYEDGCGRAYILKDADVDDEAKPNRNQSTNKPGRVSISAGWKFDQTPESHTDL